ncbi:MAG: hypothetical protein K9G67_00065 [Bacteroidales bacterium]|nr:hypothetical protein [Bacteroidales bacterium]MCF8350285.1 hypothetical protein [Bacteroidales bacterium]MCF8374724.1 hypothetical protein [Bacteroidales bacterium]
MNAGSVNGYLLCFAALPGGNRNNNGNFNNIEKNANFWSSTENGTNAWNRNLNYNNDEVNRNNNNQENGFSVRCLKNWKQFIIRPAV